MISLKKTSSIYTQNVAFSSSSDRWKQFKWARKYIHENTENYLNQSRRLQTLNRSKKRKINFLEFCHQNRKNENQCFDLIVSKFKNMKIKIFLNLYRHICKNNLPVDSSQPRVPEKQIFKLNCWVSSLNLK